GTRGGRVVVRARGLGRRAILRAFSSSRAWPGCSAKWGYPYRECSGLLDSQHTLWWSIVHTAPHTPGYAGLTQRTLQPQEELQHVCSDAHRHRSTIPAGPHLSANCLLGILAGSCLSGAELSAGYSLALYHCVADHP